MDEKLKSNLEHYKTYTVEMIENIKSDDLDNFEVALTNRQKIIEKINHLNFNKSEFKEICEQLDIIAFDNELNKITTNEKDKLKEKILGLKKSQSANTAYHSTINTSNVFSKKV